MENEELRGASVFAFLLFLSFQVDKFQHQTTTTPTGGNLVGTGRHNVLRAVTQVPKFQPGTIKSLSRLKQLVGVYEIKL